MTNNYLASYDFYAAAVELSTGQHGSFAEAIGNAYFVADNGNRQKLADAFSEVFMRGYHFALDKNTNQTESV